MGPSCMVANSILAVFSVMQLGLIPTMAEEEPMVLGVVGGQVLLPCSGNPQTDKVEWKYKENVVIQIRKDQIYKGKSQMTHRSQTNKQEITKGNFSMILSQLEPSDAGTYVCEFSFQKSRVQLQVFKVTGSPTGYLTTNDKITLKTEGSSSVSVSWSDNHKNPVTNQPQSRELKDGGHSLQINNLKIEDSGTWMCHITHKSTKLDIPYNVQVIGFINNWSLETRYASVNSTVSFSYFLNTDLQKIGERGTITGALDWRQTKDSSYQQKYNLSVTSENQPLSKKIGHMQLTAKTSNHLNVTLFKIQFEDAGWYRWYFNFSHKTVEKAIHLVVMTVSAEPVGPLYTGDNVKLLCQLSAPLPQGGELSWKHMNETKEISKKEGDSMTMIANTTGQWRCSLKVNSELKTSMDYTVVKAAERNKYVLIMAVAGASIVLLLLTSLGVFTCTARQRRRRRAEKMARIRQDLLEKRTCQCQRRMKNNYTNV